MSLFRLSLSIDIGEDTNYLSAAIRDGNDELPLWQHRFFFCVCLFSSLVYLETAVLIYFHLYSSFTLHSISSGNSHIINCYVRKKTLIGAVFPRHIVPAYTIFIWSKYQICIFIWQMHESLLTQPLDMVQTSNMIIWRISNLNYSIFICCSPHWLHKLY